jgi:hypothetical protein
VASKRNHSQVSEKYPIRRRSRNEVFRIDNIKVVVKHRIRNYLHSLTQSLISCFLGLTNSGSEFAVFFGGNTSGTPVLISESSMSMSSPEKPKLNAILDRSLKCGELDGNILLDGKSKR